MSSLPRSLRPLFLAACAAPLAVASAAAVAEEAPRAPRSPAEAVRAAADSISDARCRAHVDFLASDLLGGRSTPSHGLDVAAAYVASHFSRHGLEPGGADGGWFQSFPVIKEIRLAAHALEAGGRAYTLGKDYSPFPFTGSGRAERAGLVFAGYGITAPEEEYDDYASIDAKDKVVLILRHEPRENEEGNGPFRGTRQTRHSFFATKVQNAIKHGAAALLVADDPLNHEPRAKLDGHWPAAGGETSAYGKIPVIHVTRDLAEKLLGGKDLKKIQGDIDVPLEPRSFEVAGASLTVEARAESVPGEGRNVIGVLRGSDPAVGDEVVVIGAHYDHVGEQPDEQGAGGFPGQIGTAVAGDRIHNGADDNASGTSALLEVARAFAESGVRPRRTVAFMAFAGEELGLVGSRHYVKAPLLGPIERHVAMINLDMVGRNDAKHIFIGGNLSPALEAAIQGANQRISFKTERMNEGGSAGGGTSDHWSFQQAGVPAAFFFSGFHPDYHRVTDHAAKIVAVKVARVSQLAFLAALDVADNAGVVRPPKPAAKRSGRELF